MRKMNNTTIGLGRPKNTKKAIARLFRYLKTFMPLMVRGKKWLYAIFRKFVDCN